MNIDIGIQEYTIRSFLKTDATSLPHHANNKNIANNLKNIFPHPYTIKDAEQWIAYVKKQDPETEFAIVCSDKIIGGIGLNILDDISHKSAQLGYWLGEVYWSKGIMTKAVAAFTTYAFKTFDLIRIFTHVFETNLASARVLNKAGYNFEGRMSKSAIKNGIILDQVLYAKVI